VHGNTEPNADAFGAVAAPSEARTTTNTAGKYPPRRTERRIPTCGGRVSINDERVAMAKLLGSN
jgi:hypothetical protein